MKLLLPADVVVRLKKELRLSGRREMGGVLVGEHVEGETFRIIDLSFQRSGGSEMHFVRDPVLNSAFLADFFARTGNDFQRFNYMGEWHSHPLFHPTPSGPDIATMKQLVSDPEVGVNFALLLIVSLRRRSSIMMSATVFRPGIEPFGAEVSLETEHSEATGSFLARVRSVIRTLLR